MALKWDRKTKLIVATLALNELRGLCVVAPFVIAWMHKGGF
jgi:hypothetical protein